MKTMNVFAMIVGYFVLVLWLSGSLGVGDFELRFGPENVDPTLRYTCKRGDSIFNRQKYACGFREWTSQQAEKETDR